VQKDAESSLLQQTQTGQLEEKVNQLAKAIADSELKLAQKASLLRTQQTQKQHLERRKILKYLAFNINNKLT